MIVFKIDDIVLLVGMVDLFGILILVEMLINNFEILNK